MTAYQKYQLQWMIDHDHPLDELVARMAEYQDDCNELGRVDEIFDEWVYNVGFGGEIWACFDEFCDNEESEMYELFQKIIDKLPHEAPDRGKADIHPIWTDGTEILCRTEWLAKTIADVMDNIFGERFVHYHYYDPFEDERDGCVDDHTGWWYVDFD